MSGSHRDRGATLPIVALLLPVLILMPAFAVDLGRQRSSRRTMQARADVIALAHAVLSTSGMVRYAKQSDAEEFLVVTECGLSDRLLVEVPEKKFYKACKLCQFMKMITLDSTLRSHERMEHEIVLDEAVRTGAARSLRRMLELSN